MGPSRPGCFRFGTARKRSLAYWMYNKYYFNRRNGMVNSRLCETARSWFQISRLRLKRFYQFGAWDFTSKKSEPNLSAEKVSRSVVKIKLNKMTEIADGKASGRPPMYRFVLFHRHTWPQFDKLYPETLKNSTPEGQTGRKNDKPTFFELGLVQTPYFSCAEPDWISSTLEQHWRDIW